MVKKTNNIKLEMLNNKIPVNKQITLNLNHHIKQQNQQFKLDNEQELYGSLNILLGVVKKTIDNEIGSNRMISHRQTQSADTDDDDNDGDDEESKPTQHLNRTHGPKNEIISGIGSLGQQQQQQQSSNSPYNFLVDQKFKQSSNNQNSIHMSQRPHMQYQNMNIHSRMCPPPHHHSFHLNDNRPPPQSTHYTYAPSTTSSQQINIRHLDPGAQSRELQANDNDSQRRQSLMNDPEFQKILNDVKRPP